MEFNEKDAKKAFEEFKTELEEPTVVQKTSKKKDNQETLEKKLKTKAENFKQSNIIGLTPSSSQIFENQNEIVSVFNLPSQGKGYENPELKKGFLNVAALTGIDEERLISLKNEPDVLKSFYKILSGKIKDTGVSVYDLYVNDFFAFLFFLKHISFEPDSEEALYQFRTLCPECNRELNLEVNVGEIEFCDLQDDFSIPFVFEIEDYTFVMRCLTLLDDIEITKKTEKDKKNPIFKQQGLDTTRINSLVARTVLLKKGETVLTKGEYFNFYLNLDLKRKKILEKKLQSFDKFGTPLYTTFCQGCQKEVEVIVPLNFPKLFNLF